MRAVPTPCPAPAAPRRARTAAIAAVLAASACSGDEVVLPGDARAADATARDGGPVGPGDGALDGADAMFDPNSPDPDASGPIDLDGADPSADATAPDGDAAPVDCSAGIAPDAAVDPTRYGNVGTHRPHWGSRAHGDAVGGVYWSTVFPDMSPNRWGGCHATYRYYIDPSVTARGAAWVTAVTNAFEHWDLGAYCGPHWVRTTSTTDDAVLVRYAANSACSGVVWYACAARDAAASSTSQHWSITLNSAYGWGVGVAGSFDVESTITNELGHVMYGGHNPHWNDSVIQLNTCAWGASSCRVSSSEVPGFDLYTVCARDVTCMYPLCERRASGGCGNRRRLLPGDEALVAHIYGVNAAGCTDGTTRRCSATTTPACCAGGGSAVQTCVNERWTTGACELGCR